MLHIQSYRFRDLIENRSDDLSPMVLTSVQTEIKKLFTEDKSLSDWNKEYLVRHKSSALHVQAGLRVRALIGKEAKSTNEKDLLAILSLNSASMGDASAGLELLDEWASSAEVKDRYRDKAAERWNRASVFQAKRIDTQ